jgi:predicted O-methyltransferase YrrM
MENMRRCVEWYWPKRPVTVLDIGSANVNGSYAELFPDTTHYIGIDLEPGPGVDLVIDNPYSLPFADQSFDVIVSGQMLEHSGQFWRVFTEIERLLAPDGLLFMIAPSAGPVHRYPVDCYRFYPDSYAALADWSGLRLVHSWTDERGPWADLSGVFQKGGSLQAITAPLPPELPVGINHPPFPASFAEITKGARHYHAVLSDLHTIIQPRGYIEIGARKGASLALATAPSIAIDPAPELAEQCENVTLYTCTSDDFFYFHADTAIHHPIDFAFIDGLHLAEFVYRDFINLERIMEAGGVIVIDDVLPNHPIQASRERKSRVWTGDVWRFAQFLAEKRPDLRMTWFDTEPTGLLVISNLAPENRLLWDQYNPLVRALSESAAQAVPEFLLTRQHALAPDFDALQLASGRA